MELSIHINLTFAILKSLCFIVAENVGNTIQRASLVTNCSAIIFIIRP